MILGRDHKQAGVCLSEGNIKKKQGDTKNLPTWEGKGVAYEDGQVRD